MSGVVSRFDGRWTPEDSLLEGLNVDLDDPSRPCKRQGYTQLEAGTTGLLPATRLSGLGYLDAGVGRRLLVAAQSESSGQISYVRALSEPQWTPAASFNVATDDCKMFQGNFLLWLLTGPSANMVVVGTDGVVTDCGNSNGAPPTGAVDGVSLFERIFLVDVDGLYWSKIQVTVPDLEAETAFDRANLGNLTADKGFMRLAPPFGGQPKAMAVWNQRTLLVFYDTATLEIVVDAADPVNSIVNVIEPRYGCSSRATVEVVGREVFFQDQYGDYRSLAQTITGAQQGVVAEPLSESIRPDVPGAFTPGQLAKSRSVLYRDRVYHMVATGTSEEAKTVWAFDLPRRHWYGPWELADGMSSMIISDIDGKEQRILAASASDTTPLTYELFDGSYSDDGTAITYKETSRLIHGGSEEKNKQPRFVECFAKGGLDATVKVRLRTDENKVWTRVLSFTLEDDGSIFPIKEAGETGSIMPIAEAGESGSPFPISEAVPLLTRGWENLEVPEPSEFDIPNSRFDIPASDFPILDEGGGVTPGRFVQWQVEEVSSNGFERQALHVATDIQEMVRDEED